MLEPKAELAAALRRSRRTGRRRRRAAALVYVAAGGTFGTCVYLARTRLSAFVHGHTWPLLVLLVALAVGLFVLATCYEADARSADADTRELEERLERIRRG